MRERCAVAARKVTVATQNREFGHFFNHLPGGGEVDRRKPHAVTALDFRHDAAVFSVFRRASEMPLYSIEKRPRLKDRQGQYSVVAAGGQVLGRGHDLTAVLRVLERRLLKAVPAE